MSVEEEREWVKIVAVVGWERGEQWSAGRSGRQRHLSSCGRQDPAVLETIHVGTS